MGVNKVVYDGVTLIDISTVTVTPETLAEGVTAYNAQGELIVGRAKVVTTSAALGKAVLGTMRLGEGG